MSKDAFYFPHDYYARNDPKLQRLLMDFGLAGIGAYWCIVEILYENCGICRKCDTRAIAFGLHCDESLVASILENYDLFEKTAEGDYFSASANDRIARRAEVAEKRSAAGRKGNEVRWKNGSIANASESVANATENHRKTSQGKEIKENIDISLSTTKKKTFVKPTIEEVEEYVREKGYAVDAESFISFYESNGWKVGSNPMKSWRAAVTTWQKRIVNDSKSNGTINQRTHRGSDSGYVPDYSQTKF